MNVQPILTGILLLLGVGFLIANIKLGYDYFRYVRVRRGALLTWPGPKPPQYAMMIALGVALGLLVFTKQFILRRQAFGEAMMCLYYAYFVPKSRTIGRGFYEDGIWADNAFIPTVRRLGVPVIVGDATVAPVLRQAHAATARAIVAATNNDLINLEIALLVRELAPRQRVVVRMTDSSLALTLRQAANVRLALSVPELTAPTFVASILGDRARDLFFIQGRLLIAYDVLISSESSSLAGQPVAALAAEHHFAPVALLSADGSMRPINPDTTLAPGDRLTAILSQTDLQRLLQREATGAGSVPAPTA